MKRTLTVKEFSDAYDIPYKTVYNATYKVKPVKNDIYCKEYDEDELYAAVQSEINQKLLILLRKVHDLNDIKDNMRRKRQERLSV